MCEGGGKSEQALRCTFQGNKCKCPRHHPDGQRCPECQHVEQWHTRFAALPTDVWQGARETDARRAARGESDGS